MAGFVARERELEDEILSRVAGVVDFYLVQLFALRPEGEAWRLGRSDRRRRSEDENDPPWRRRRERVDIVDVVARAELHCRRVLVVGGTESSAGGQTSDESCGDEGWHQPPASECGLDRK